MKQITITLSEGNFNVKVEGEVTVIEALGLIEYAKSQVQYGKIEASDETVEPVTDEQV